MEKERNLFTSNLDSRKDDHIDKENFTPKNQYILAFTMVTVFAVIGVLSKYISPDKTDTFSKRRSKFSSIYQKDARSSAIKNAFKKYLSTSAKNHSQEEKNSILREKFIEMLYQTNITSHNFDKNNISPQDQYVYNTRLLTSTAALLLQTPDTKKIIQYLYFFLGNELHTILTNKNFELSWEDDPQKLLLKVQQNSHYTIYEVPLISFNENIEKPLSYNTPPQSITYTPEAKNFLQTKHTGEYEIRDAIIGKNKTIVIRQTDHYNKAYSLILSLVKNNSEVNIHIACEPFLNTIAQNFFDKLCKNKEFSYTEKKQKFHNAFNNYGLLEEDFLFFEAILQESIHNSSSKFYEDKLNKYTIKKYYEKYKEIGIPENILKNNVQFSVIDNLKGDWTRDPILPTYNNKGEIVLQGTENTFNGQNNTFAKSLSKKLSVTYKKLNIPFDGGDFFPIGPYLFLGQETLDQYIAQCSRTYDHSLFVLPNGEKKVIGFQDITSKEFIELINYHYPEKDFVYSEKIVFLPEYFYENNPDIFIEKEQESVYFFNGKILEKTQENKEYIIKNSKENIEKLTGKKLHIIGENFKQALFHLDTFIDFDIDKNGELIFQILDQKITHDLLKNTSPEKREQIEKKMLLQAVYAQDFSADEHWDQPQSFFQPNTKMKMLQRAQHIRYDIFNSLSNYILDIRNNEEYTEFQKNLDDAAKWAIENGFKVERIPSFIHFNSKRRFKNTSHYSYFYASYANNLTEIYAENNTVKKTKILGYYGIEALEEYIDRLHKKNGYKTVFTPNMLRSASYKGGVHCSTNEIEKK